jgi:Melibiase/Alpha galactosidase C-terminal beta sandwich domain
MQGVSWCTSRKFSLLMISVGVAISAAPVKVSGQVTVISEGWTVTADGDKGLLSVSREDLGTVLQGVRLNLRGEHGLQPLKNWSVEKHDDSQISILTSEPQAAKWVLKFSPEALRISTTTAEGVLTAEAPAPSDRIVARLLDPQGAPVTWRGTFETHNDLGGGVAQNPSFLPRQNPEVMYLSLGQVSSSNLHSLFDRKTDVAIDFTEQTTMLRNGNNPDLLDVTIPVPGNTQIQVIPDYFTKTLGLPDYLPFDDSNFKTPPAVWSSWTSYYSEVNEQDIVQNPDWIAANLKPYGFEYVELDDGYDAEVNGGTYVGFNHTWLNWDHVKFPHGAKWLTDYIKSKGLRTGIWLVPNASAAEVKEHPDWYLRYKDGIIVKDYQTPTLDSTNPQALDFVKKEMATLDDWGFDYYKFDGEHDFLKYVPGVDIDKIWDKSVDPIVAYRNRLKMIRETIGPHRFIEGCPSGVPLNGIGYFDSYFNGDDVYNSWQGMYNLFSSISDNVFLNHLVVYVMPGEGMELLPPMTVEEATRKRRDSVVKIARTREDPMMGFGTTIAEAHTVVSYVSLTGVIYPMGSIMSELPAERVQLLKETLPPMPIFPVDLFSRGTDSRWDIFKHTSPDVYIHNYPEILDLKVNAQSGVYDVVALTNWRSSTATRQLSFAAQLGLNPDALYVVFDFWQQKLLGEFKGTLDVTIEPHDTRVLLIHTFEDLPQLVGTSRHISGAYSIKELTWDGPHNRLRGTSDTVPGDNYTLWIYVPKGIAVSRVSAKTKDHAVLSTQHDLNGNALKVSFPGQQEAVDWEVDFGVTTSQ